MEQFDLGECKRHTNDPPARHSPAKDSGSVDCDDQPIRLGRLAVSPIPHSFWKREWRCVISAQAAAQWPALRRACSSSRAQA